MPNPVVPMRTVLALLLVGLAACVPPASRPLPIPASRLTSDDPAARSAAFHEMLGQAERDARLPPDDRRAGPRLEPLVARAQRQDSLAVSLIRLLERENAHKARHARDLSESWQDYYRTLGDAVAMLGDKRSAKALVGALDLGPDVLGAVVQLGEAAVPALLATLRTGPDESGAALALGRMIANRTSLGISSPTIDEIRNALLATISSRGDYLARKNAIDALQPLTGEGIRRVLETVAQREPAGEGSETVRVAARDWLLKHPRGVSSAPVPSTRFESPDPAVRAAAFYEVRDDSGSLAVRARARDSLAVALIQLLERENAYVRAHADSLPRDYADGYYASVGEAVAGLDDPRAVKALVGAMRIGYAPVNSMIRMGRRVVPDLLAMVRGPEAANAVVAIGYIFERRDITGIDSRMTTTIIDTLVSVIRGPGDPRVRTNAIKALMSVQGDVVLAAMQQVSDREPPGEGSAAVVAAARAWLVQYGYRPPPLDLPPKQPVRGMPS